ncbi:MAG: MerR family transcriptional regulator [Anaerocolumna sp.]
MAYTSGEFAKIMEISLDTLRYYEKEGLVKPEIKPNGRRIYEEGDVRWMEFIRRLKDTGMPIKDICRYSQLRAKGEITLEERMTLLVEHRHMLKAKIELLQENLGKLDDKIEFYRNEIAHSDIMTNCKSDRDGV